MQMITANSRFAHRVDTLAPGGMDLDELLLNARRRGLYVTDAGIAIGLAHVPRPRREIGVEAEKIQRVLLKPRKKLPNVAPAQLVVEVGRRPLWWRALRAVRQFLNRPRGPKL